MNKHLIKTLIVGGLALALPSGALAEEKEKTVLGEGACSKCILKQGETCQQTVTAEDEGRRVTYHITQNAVAKAFGHQVCKERKAIKATGTVKNVEGRMELTPTKIELVSY